MQSPSGGTRPTGDGSQVKASLERENKTGQEEAKDTKPTGFGFFSKKFLKIEV